LLDDPIFPQAYCWALHFRRNTFNDDIVAGREVEGEVFRKNKRRRRRRQGHVFEGNISFSRRLLLT